MEYVHINTCDNMSIACNKEDKSVYLNYMPNGEEMDEGDNYIVNSIESFIAKAKELFPECIELSLSIGFTDDRIIPPYNHEEAVKNRDPVVFNKSKYKDDIQKELKDLVTQIYPGWTKDINVDSPAIYNIYARNVDFYTMLNIADEEVINEDTPIEDINDDPANMVEIDSYGDIIVSDYKEI